jgi:hypothetical protein
VGKHFGSKKQFYYEFGMFSSYLFSSRFTAYDAITLDITSVEGPPIYPSNRVVNYTGSDYITVESRSEKDAKMHNRFDMGFLGGIGYTYNINEKIDIITGIRANISILKLGRFNNEYRESFSPTATGFQYNIESKNYMFGLNSQARNISFNLSVGMLYRL